MKTHQIFLILLLSCISASACFAQTDYSTTHVIQGDGYTYQCDNKHGGMAKLYNSNDQFTYAKWIRKDGVPIDEAFLFTRTITNGFEGREKADQIVRQIFNTEELNSVRESPLRLMVTMIINPDTGKVDEVNFEFPVPSGYSRVPVEKYRQIELTIKQNITFSITEAGKKLNYCTTALFFEP